jgi:predicted MFS family arabinose efflux permease
LPNRVRGRVFSTQFAIQSLGAAASSAFGGWAIDHVAGGVQTMLIWMGGLIIVPGILWLLWTFYGKVAETQLADDSVLIPRTVLDPPKTANK